MDISLRSRTLQPVLHSVDAKDWDRFLYHAQWGALVTTCCDARLDTLPGEDKIARYKEEATCSTDIQMTLF